MATTKEIVDYVMDSPSNTNPAVLRSLLNEHMIDLDFRELVIINNRSQGSLHDVAIDNYYIENNEVRCMSHTIHPGETYTLHLPFSYSSVTKKGSVLYFIIRASESSGGAFSVSQEENFLSVLGELEASNMRQVLCVIRSKAPQGYEVVINDAT